MQWALTVPYVPAPPHGYTLTTQGTPSFLTLLPFLNSGLGWYFCCCYCCFGVSNETGFWSCHLLAVLSHPSNLISLGLSVLISEMGTKYPPCKDWVRSSMNAVCECMPRASAGKASRLWGNPSPEKQGLCGCANWSLFPSSTSHPSPLFCARATRAFLQEEEGASPERPDCEGDAHRGISALLRREGAGRVSSHHHQEKPGPEEEVVPWALALPHPGVRSH